MNPDERDSVAISFGVSPEQVERDHLISYLLAAIASRFSDDVNLIGGTALARTHLPGGRLSEDIDLVALGDRDALAAQIDDALPRAVQRTHGRLAWAPALSEVRDTGAAILRGTGGLSIKIQLLSARNRTLWPYALRPLEQRFEDAPPARLTVPTLPAFTASKTTTWHHRRASRDLWDLWSLASIGAIDSEAGALYRKYGPTNRLPSHHLFDTAPLEREWRSQLAGQTTLTVAAADALTVIRDAWANVEKHANS